MESDGEDELVDEDEEFDEDAIAGGSVSSSVPVTRVS